MNSPVRTASPFSGSTHRMLSSGLESVLPDFVRSAGGFGTGADPELDVPAKWDDYEIVQKIGHGGMGAVYLAWQAGLERFVALKFLHRDLNLKSEFVERFRREAKMAASLQHPNVVRVHEVGEVDGRLYFAMDFIEGRDLAEVLKDGPLPWEKAARYGYAIARAMEYAHGRWVFHRDLKPSNVLIDLGDQPLVMDFGIAGQVEVPSHLTAFSNILGSPGYLSPEQAAGRMDDVTTACDIHAIGVILYECLTGKPPFRADTVQGTLLRVREHQPAELRSKGSAIPPDLEIICRKCLEKEPERRYASAQALADDLDRCLKGERIQARAPTLMDHTCRWLRKHPRIAFVFASVCATMLLCVSILVYQNMRLAGDNSRIQRDVAGDRKRLVEAYILLGEKWREDNQTARAEEYFRKAREIAGDDPVLLSRVLAVSDQVAGR